MVREWNLTGELGIDLWSLDFKVAIFLMILVNGKIFQVGDAIKFYIQLETEY